MTPQQIEALKLALEALEGFYEYGYDRQECFEHITAIKEALLEHAMHDVQRLGQEIEQEPVAWPCLIDSADFSENTITLAMQCEDYKVSAGTHWLSITPPQRTWVGLNEDEIDYLIHLAYTGDEEFVQTIEAKLKEKNT